MVHVHMLIHLFVSLHDASCWSLQIWNFSFTFDVVNQTVIFHVDSNYAAPFGAFKLRSHQVTKPPFCAFSDLLTLMLF